MLGGCSAINFMAYGRPSRQDLDNWASKFDLPGWSWDDLLPYFKKSERLDVERRNTETCQNINAPFHPDLHGNAALGGIIHSSIGPWQFPFERVLHKAMALHSGFSNPIEPYSGEHVGFYRSLFTIDRQGAPKRSYAASYLSFSPKTNLHILTKAHVTKVQLELANSKPTATGVSFIYDGVLHSISAKRVILSAGSFQSPQILQLSGIGDPEALEKASIPCVVKNQHVGRNLQEHVMCPVVYELAAGVESVDSILASTELFKKHQELYKNSHDGAFSGAVGLTGYLPYSSLVSKQQLDKTSTGCGFDTYDRRWGEAISGRIQDPLINTADIQFVASPGNFDAANGYSDCAKIMAGAPSGGGACYSIVVSGMYPVSHGSVQVKSDDPLEPPTINPNFLSHSADVDVLVAGIRFADEIFKSESVSDMVTKRVSPAPDVDLESESLAREYVHNNITTYHHATGTCSMGSVVDHRLRVNGVEGLCIVDASIMPTQVSTAIMATVYAIAEKAAVMIQEDMAAEAPQ